MSNDHDLDDFRVAVEHNILYKLHTSMLGKIVAYHPTTQTADVQPLTMGVTWEPVVIDDVPVGQKTYFRHDVIRQVPVNFPGGSNFTVTWPLAAGDVVLLVFNEDSIADLLVSGDEAPQTDLARHALGNASAYPVKLPTDKAPSTDPVTTGNAKMLVGKAGGTQIVIDATGNKVTITAAEIDLGGTSDHPALASVVDKILAAFTAWTVVSMDGGAALKAALAAQSLPITSKSTVVKLGG